MKLIKENPQNQANVFKKVPVHHTNSQSQIKFYWWLVLGILKTPLLFKKLELFRISNLREGEWHELPKQATQFKLFKDLYTREVGKKMNFCSIKIEGSLEIFLTKILFHAEFPLVWYLVFSLATMDLFLWKTGNLY